MSSDDAEAVPKTVCSTSSSPSDTAEGSGRHFSVFSSPVSDLAFNLEVLSTDGFSSQGSSSSEGYEFISIGYSYWELFVFALPCIIIIV